MTYNMVRDRYGRGRRGPGCRMTERGRSAMKTRRTAAAIAAVILIASQAGYLPVRAAGSGLGDLNSDGIVDSRDASYVRTGIVNLESKKPDGITPSAFFCGDVDRNAVLDEADAEWIEKYAEYVSGGGTAGIREFITGVPDKEGYSDYGTFNEGKNTWAVTGDYTLELGGEGELPDVIYNWNQCPWAGYSQTRKLKKIVIGEGVERVGDYLFRNVSTVTEAEFPSTLVSVGKWAFTNCFGITEVKLPEGVTSLGEKAFGSCQSLEKVSVPSTVKVFGSGVFSGCSKLSEVTLAEGLAILGTECFRGAEALKEITLPESLVDVAPKAFMGTGLTLVTIPDKVKNVGNYAFSDCGSLTSATVGKGTELIGSGAFKNCTALETVTLNEGLDTIGSGAFENCSSLKNVKIPDSVTVLGDGAFTGCTSVTEITVPEKVKRFSFTGLDTCTSLAAVIIENPDCVIDTSYYGVPLDGVTVYCYPGSSAEEAAKKCGARVVLMDGKTAVKAQGECGEGLEWTLNNRGVLRITGKGTMKDFDEYETEGWREYPDLVTSLIIEAEIPGIGANAFDGLPELGTVVIPDTLTCIGDGAFRNCTGISKIEFPSALESIGKEAFRGCTGMYYLDLPEGLKSIGEGAFRGSSVVSAELPAGVEKVCSGTFADCKHFLRLETPSPDCVIEDGAIPEEYRAVMIAAPVESAAKKYADENGLLFVSADPESELACSGKAGDNITWKLLRNGVLEITGSGDIYDWDNEAEGRYYMGRLSPWNYCREMEFGRTPAVTAVDISGDITRIGEQSFYGCDMTEVELPESLESIGSMAFNYCHSLKGIVIPENVRSVGKGAFGECRKLEEITFLRPDCEIADDPQTVCSGIDQEKMTRVSNSDEEQNIYQFNGVIKGYKDSTAEKYAEKYGYSFVSIGEAQEQPVIAGDANEDGKVNVSDAVAVLQYVANQVKYPLSERGVKNADCDGAVGITGSDALIIQQIDAGIYKP